MSHITRVVSAIRTHGVAGIAGAVVGRVVAPESAVLRGQRHRFHGRVGLEVGGPSRIFTRGRLLPVYPLARRVDNVNFAATTAWEHTEPTFRPDPANEPGAWAVSEMTALPHADASYDFALTAHAIEHTANPLRALAELRRVLRPGGALVIVLPDKRRTFDHRRPVTTLEHLRRDDAEGVGEDDLTHLPEIIALHDVRRDPGAPRDAAAFRERGERNAANRCLHHHVFDLPLMRAMLATAGFVVLASDARAPADLICVAVTA